MAEGFARHLLSDRINPYSAGVEPHGMNPRAMKVMDEAGAPIDSHHSKHVDELVKDGVAFDFVVTVCGHADEACPILPGPAARIHRGFDDPPKLAKDASNEEEILSHYRRVRDQIRDYVSTRLIPDLDASRTGASDE